MKIIVSFPARIASMKNLSRFLFVKMILCACLIAATGSSLNAQAASSPASGSVVPAKHTCMVRSTPMSVGDIALARNEYAKAIDAYTSEMSVAGGEAGRAHNGRIRALLAADKITEAEAAANTWAATSPSDSWSATSLGEIQLRQGKIPEAFATLQSALAADSCNARTRADLARIYKLTGMFATAKRILDSAHTLDPVDDEIQRQWIFSEPMQAQAGELEKYMQLSASFLTEDRKAELVQRQKRLGLALTDSCRLTTPVASNRISYYMVQNGPKARIFWGMEVIINGKKLRLSEDSTISGILLTKSAAKDLHLQPVEDVEVGGIGSQAEVTATVARTSDVRIGSFEFQNCDVLVSKDDMMSFGETAREKAHNVYIERGSDGLIGPDAFRDFLLTLDKPDHKLILDPLPEPAGANAPTGQRLVTGVAPESEPLHDRYVDPSMKDWTRGFRSDQFPMFPVRINAGPVGFFTLATNSRLNSLSLETARQMGIAGDAPKELPSMSGHNSVFFWTSDVTLEFLGQKQQLDHMAAIDSTVWSHNHGEQITGFLGAPLLDMFTIHLDYRDNLIKFDYDPKRIPHCPPNFKMPGCY